MARYDKRGVVIPAPLQGSDSALSGRRYGDKHRGPAVSDAYELSRCWIDLAERSEHWPSPSNLPPRMVDLAQAVPEDQRADWLRRQANLEKVDRHISYAIRAGDLPIWVAPHGEPERLVATGALATIDKRSIASGVFCPLSEEYKSEADKPWLWERPLFVKWNDWVRFADRMDAKNEVNIEPATLGVIVPPQGQLKGQFPIGENDVQNQVVSMRSANGRNSPELLQWGDFGAEALPKLRKLRDLAWQDEWWSWPEAIAWIGGRDANNIATLRYWGREWFGRGGGDRDPTIILGAQAFIATQICKSGGEPEADLLNAIQCGHVGTSGRLSKGAVATDLQASIWRGGTVVWHDGETVLVDAKQKLTAWAFDVAIRRKDLVATFQPEGPGRVVAGGNVPANRKLNHDEIIGQAASMIAAQPGISKGSAAASIVADLPRNPRTGRPRDTRHIERMIAHLWEGGLSQSPR